MKDKNRKEFLTYLIESLMRDGTKDIHLKSKLSTILIDLDLNSIIELDYEFLFLALSHELLPITEDDLYSVERYFN